MYFLSIISIFILLVIFLRYVIIYFRSLRLSNLSKRPVLITGCDSGFGNATAIKLSKLGIPVIATCLSETNAIELKEKYNIETIIMDVSKEEDLLKALNHVNSYLKKIACKGLWALINNAGIAHPIGYVDFLTVNDFESICKVNLFGLINTTIKFLPLIKQCQGRIINTASMLGRCSQLMTGPYIVSKFGVEGFSDTLRREMSYFKVKVCTIEPGYFYTGILKNTPLNMNNVNERLQLEYGEDLETKWNLLNENFIKKHVNFDISTVVDAYTMCVIGKYPKTRCTIGNDARINCFINMFPDFVSDFIFYWKMRNLNVPVPKPI